MNVTIYVLIHDIPIATTQSPLTQRMHVVLMSKMASVGCFLVIYLLQGFVLGEHQQNTLNVANVLLPYVPRGSVHTNFTLKALQGCFLWYVLSNHFRARAANSVPAILHIFWQPKSCWGFNFSYFFSQDVTQTRGCFDPAFSQQRGRTIW